MPGEVLILFLMMWLKVKNEKLRILSVGYNTSYLGYGFGNLLCWIFENS
jgi:hypothetical protein